MPCRLELLPVGGLAVATAAAWLCQPPPPHGTVVSPMSRVYRVYQSNPQNPNFPLAANAIAIDGTSSYYTWNEVSRNIPQAVQANLPPGFDYSPWIPDGQLASAGRVDPTAFPRTYAGLDQVSGDWPKTTVTGGETIGVSFLATAPHNPSVWDVWLTTPDWDASTPLRWSHMEFLGRPSVTFTGTHYDFNLTIPADRVGHHVLWVAWQRDDPVGEVFISTSDIQVLPVNDECDGAVAVSLGQNGPFDLTHATVSGGPASCEVGSNVTDLWFTYTAECTGTLRAATCATAGALDTIVSIWSGSCGALTEIGCDDNGCGSGLAAATANVVQNVTYYVKVSARTGSGSVPFDLTMSYDNGTGSFQVASPGCGTATLAATGAPNLGGIVDYAVQGGSGSTQAMVLGFAPATTAMCAGCTLGTSSFATMPGQVSLTIPCDPGLIGVRWWVQGVDAFGVGGGGCNYGSGIDFTLTDTVLTVVGS